MKRGENHLICLIDFLWLTHLYSGGECIRISELGAPAMKAVLQGLSSFLYTQSNIPTVCDFSGGYFDKGRKNKPAMNVVICQ